MHLVQENPTILKHHRRFAERNDWRYFTGWRAINDIPTNKRDVHTVFNLTPCFHRMNVFENVAFPYVCVRSIKEIEQRVLEVLKMVQLEGFEKRSIRKLSGDNASGLAIARAIINNHV